MLFALCSLLSPFHFDNPCCSQPARCNLQLHYARPLAAKAVEASLSSFIFALSSLTTFAVRNPRGATYSCTTRDPLLQRLSKLPAFIFHLSTLTTFAVRNPRGATCSCTTRDLLLQKLSKLRFHLSSLLFHLSTLTYFAVRNPRGATCSCTTRDLLLQRLSKLRFHLSSFIFDILCRPQPARCNLQLHYARPVAAKAIEAFSFRVIFYTRRRWISKITLYLQSVLCIEQINT